MIQHPVPEKLLIQIGDITVSFALLESTIRLLTGSLVAEHQRIGQIITAELAFKNLRAMTVSLYKERHGEDEDFSTLRHLMQRAAKLEEIRNQITHSLWGAGSAADTITRIKTTAKEKQGIRFQFQQIRESDLADIAQKMKRLAGDVQAFWIRLIDTAKAINNPVMKAW